MTVEYKSIIHECTIALQEEYAREQSQLQLDQMLQLKKQQHPKVLYQSQEKEIEIFQYELLSTKFCSKLS